MPLVNGFAHLTIQNALLVQVPASTSFVDVRSDLTLDNAILRYRPEKVELPGQSLVLENALLKRKA